MATGPKSYEYPLFRVIRVFSREDTVGLSGQTKQQLRVVCITCEGKPALRVSGFEPSLCVEASAEWQDTKNVTCVDTESLPVSSGATSQRLVVDRTHSASSHKLPKKLRRVEQGGPDELDSSLWPAQTTIITHQPKHSFRLCFPLTFVLVAFIFDTSCTVLVAGSSSPTS